MEGQYIGGSPGGGSWGSITGTLSRQTDLNTALNGKAGTTKTIIPKSPGDTILASEMLGQTVTITQAGSLTFAAAVQGGSVLIDTLRNAIVVDLHSGTNQFYHNRILLAVGAVISTDGAGGSTLYCECKEVVNGVGIIHIFDNEGVSG